MSPSPITTKTPLARFDPLAPDVLPDPYPHYARLRCYDPIHWGLSDDPAVPGRWYITRLDDIVDVLKDSRFGREVHSVLPPERIPPTPAADRLLAEVAEGWMILRDPPVHTHLRGLVNRAFTPRMVARLTPDIEATAEQLITAMEAETGPVDLLTAFALPLPIIMVAQVLGLPTTDRDQLMDWSRALAAVIDLNQTEAVRERSRMALEALVSYLTTIIGQRRRQPQDDLLSALIDVEHEGQKLSDEELIGTVTHLLFVGNDPVMHLIGNGIVTLLHHPDQMAWLRANPDRIEPAVDELLRYDSSVQMTFRYTLTDVELGGKRLHTGDHVAVVLGSANRDPAYHADPDRLDLTRPAANLLHFGKGIHYCLGAPLARIEGQIAINTLLRRLPQISLATDTLVWQKTAAVRGLQTLPVKL